MNHLWSPRTAIPQISHLKYVSWSFCFYEYEGLRYLIHVFNDNGSDLWLTDAFRVSVELYLYIIWYTVGYRYNAVQWNIILYTGLQQLGQNLTHWGRVTHVCVGKLTIIGSDNGLSPGRRQTIIWTNAGILLIGPLGTNFSEILVGIQTFSFKKIHLKMSSAKWRPFCIGLNVF